MLKRFLPNVLSAVLLLLIWGWVRPAYADNCGPFLRGDVNEDGQVTVQDLVGLIPVVLGQSPRVAECVNALDLNDDGQVNIVDLQYLASFLFNHGPNPKAPFPSMGFQTPINPAAAFSHAYMLNSTMNNTGLSVNYVSNQYSFSGIAENSLAQPVPYIATVNASGMSLASKQVTLPSDLQNFPIVDVKRAPDNGYYFAVVVAGVTGVQSTIVKMLPQQLTGIYRLSWRYDSPVGFVAKSLTTIDTASVLVAGAWQVTSTTQNPLLAKVTSGALAWQQTYTTGLADGVANIVKQTTDGGFIVAGNAFLSSQLSVDFLWRLNAAGNPVWYQTYSLSTGRVYETRDVIQTADGGFLSVGTYVDFGSAMPNSDAEVFKTDSSGIQIWTHSLGSPTTNEAAEVAVQISANQIIVGGTYGDPTQNTIDGMILSFSNNGMLQWARHYNGGQSLNALYDIYNTGDLGFTLVGSTRDLVTPLSQKAWIMRETANGATGQPLFLQNAS